MYLFLEYWFISFPLKKTFFFLEYKRRSETLWNQFITLNVLPINLGPLTGIKDLQGPFGELQGLQIHPSIPVSDKKLIWIVIAIISNSPDQITWKKKVPLIGVSLGGYSGLYKTYLQGNSSVG